MPMFIISIQSMNETAQNAPIGIGVMNGKLRSCTSKKLPFISKKIPTFHSVWNK